MCYSGFYNIGVEPIWDMVYEYFDFVKKTDISTTAAMNKANTGCMSQLMRL